MIIREDDALWAANEFIDYFKRFKTIEDYIRFTKEAAVAERGKSLFSLKMNFLMRISIQRRWILKLDL